MVTNFNRDMGHDKDPRIIGEALVEQIRADKLGMMTAGQEVVVDHHLINEVETAVRGSSQTDPEQILKELEEKYFHYRDIKQFISPKARALLINCIKAFREQIPAQEQKN